uniref:CARD domain-containing protein n=1 Tax=Plectus sambesii TaxID=2011161 RepID=A0A914X299_9BILA
MKEEHRNAIENCRPGLIQTIVSSRCLEVLIDHLGSRDQYGNYGLTPENIIEISGGHHTSEATKVRTLLAILPTRGENAFDRFISAVRATNQIGLIEILNTNMPPNQQIPVQGSTSAASKDAPASLLANEQGNVNIVHGVMRVERDFNQIVHNHPPAQPLLFPSPPTPEELKKMLARYVLRSVYF